MQDLQYFPKDYEHSRRRFLEHAAQLKTEFLDLEQGYCHVPSSKDRDLYMDWLFIPAKSTRKNLLVITSGVHGMEAYTGSAIQEMFLSELIHKTPIENTGLLLFHCMNPFGFKNHRRSTEANVNLNRNFASKNDSKLFKTKNPEYSKLASLLAPDGPAYGRARNLAITAKAIGLAMWKEKMSIADFVRAVAVGQYDFPDGLEYGGKELEPQVQEFVAQLKMKLKDYEDLLHFDLHTGLGEQYQLHLIPSTSPESLNTELFAKLLKTDQDRDVYQFTPTTSKGFYSTHGDLNNMLPDLLSPGQRMAAVTVEFGTLGNSVFDKLATFSRMIAENRAYHRGYASHQAELETRKDFEELFYPKDEKWKMTAIRRARELFSRVLARL